MRMKTIRQPCVALLAILATGCSAESSPKEYEYLPADLSRPSALTRAEELVLRYELHAARSPLGLSIGVVEGLPSAYVESASVTLHDDHVALHVKVDISRAGGRKLWSSKATPAMREKVYTHVVSKAVDELCLRLKCSPDKVRVTWVNVNTQDKGAFIDGKLTGTYGNGG